MRGFKQDKNAEDTADMKRMKQALYHNMEKSYNPYKHWMDRPAYCIGERRKKWEQEQKENQNETKKQI